MRPTYANVMSTVAVFIAMGGTSYAVASLPRNSVGEPQLKKSAVTGEKVKDGSLTTADLAAGTLQSGPRGPRGAEGPAGPSGAMGPAGPGISGAEAWQLVPYTPGSGWTDYAVYAPKWERGSFRKDQFGYVELRGVVTKVSGTPNGDETIATLPLGYRPKRDRLFTVQSGESSQAGRIHITSAGEIIWSGGGALENDYTSFEGLRFSVD